MFRSRGLAAAAALAAMTVQSAAAQAQQPCITEDEVSAMAIYSVPNLVEGVRVRCGAALSPRGFLNQPNSPIKARYAALQARAWPQAKAGMVKLIAAKSGSSQNAQNLAMIGTLPDNSVRPLVDALIVQEVAGKVDVRQCGRIERIVELAAPIDPATAGNVLGAVIGLVNPKEIPMCTRRS